jgi:hypothetical protein
MPWQGEGESPVHGDVAPQMVVGDSGDDPPGGGDELPLASDGDDLPLRLVWSGQSLEVVAADHGRGRPVESSVPAPVWWPEMYEERDKGKRRWSQRLGNRSLNPAKRALHKEMLESERAPHKLEWLGEVGWWGNEPPPEWEAPSNRKRLIVSDTYCAARKWLKASIKFVCKGRG